MICTACEHGEHELTLYIQQGQVCECACHYLTATRRAALQTILERIAATNLLTELQERARAKERAKGNPLR